ncbi:MAG TPA: peptidylprolyl isomerase, partial [Phycisphaerae bacterium]|nr:peptidylprolyl isomerase [Phycisphaerae bacterium]
SQPVPAVSRDDVLALVNGEPIRRSTVAALLMECHGLSMLESLVLLAAAKQKAAQMSLTVTPADIKTAHEDALRQLSMPFIGPDRPPLDRPTAERLLNSFLATKNISRREWELRMEQRAYIARIASAEVAKTEITEAMLRSQYEQDFGEKVQVRHIQLSSLAQVTRARALLAVKDFELVARQMSENELTASQGGLMPPFTRKDPAVPPLLRETAFSLKVGEVSTAVHEQSWYHLIKVERRFPASSVTFENADKDNLRGRVLDDLRSQRIDDLEQELFRGAAVDIRDINLNTMFRDKYRKVGP